MEEDWRGTGGGLEADWRRIGGRLEVDWRWIGDGLEVDWRIGGGLEEGLEKDWRRIGGGLEEDWGCSKWLEIAKNDVLRFLLFYPLISAFQALSCIPNDRS